MKNRLGIAGFLVLAIAVNLPYEYGEVLSQTLGVHMLPESSSTEVIPESTISMAGWPVKFFASVQVGDFSTRTAFSSGALILNLLIWLAIAGAGLAYQRSKRRSVALEGTDAPNRADKKHRQMRLVDLFLITSAVASIFGFWQLMRARAESDMRLSERIVAQGGAVHRVAMLPLPVKFLVQVGGFGNFLRISEAELFQPDDALVAEVVGLPSLRSLFCAGGDYEIARLAPLAKLVAFQELGVVGRSLNADDVTILGSIHSLLSLNLMRTNITADGILSLSGLSQLLDLNLIHTDVILSEFGRPTFADSLRRLNLPHPPAGQGDELRLEGWPELQVLSCYEFDELMNRSPVTLTLKNLPKLETLELDSLQLYDLNLDNLSLLSGVLLSDRQWQQRTSSAQIVPATLWLRELRLKEVPNMRELTVYAASLEHISVDQKELHLTLGLTNKSQLQAEVYSPMVLFSETQSTYESAVAIDIPKDQRQRWLDELGTKAVITGLSLTEMPLQDLQLDVLAQNRSIRHLNLDATHVDQRQILCIKSMNQLEELSLVRLEIDNQTVEQLTKSLPNLVRLGCDRRYLQRLRLENNDTLESIFATPPTIAKPGSMPVVRASQSLQTPMDALKITNVARLSDYFVLTGKILGVHIDNAPALTGLSFATPLPSKAHISGVRDLKFFAAGGLNCTDGIVNEVANCVGLERLTLAYVPQLSDSTQLKICNLKQLRSLDLTGTRLSDHNLMQLGNLTQLRRLSLSGTTLTGAVLKSLKNCKELQYLNLANLSIQPGEIELIGQLRSLKYLDISGAIVTSESMRVLASLPDLERLNLSNIDLPNETLAGFFESPPAQLEQLLLKDSTLGEEAFGQLVRKLPAVRFDVSDDFVPPNVMDYLISEQRLVGPLGNRFLGMPQLDESLIMVADEIGEIDSRKFAQE